MPPSIVYWADNLVDDYMTVDDMPIDPTVIAMLVLLIIVSLWAFKLIRKAL